jgi:hypothetical protein
MMYPNNPNTTTTTNAMKTNDQLIKSRISLAAGPFGWKTTILGSHPLNSNTSKTPNSGIK